MKTVLRPWRTRAWVESRKWASDRPSERSARAVRASSTAPSARDAGVVASRAAISAVLDPIELNATARRPCRRAAAVSEASVDSLHRSGGRRGPARRAIEFLGQAASDALGADGRARWESERWPDRAAAPDRVSEIRGCAKILDRAGDRSGDRASRLFGAYKLIAMTTSSRLSR